MAPSRADRGKDSPAEAPRAPGRVVVMASDAPMHRQISRILESRIVNGLYPPGTQIPVESRLCEEFGVSRITMRQALSALVARGLLTRHRGRGTVVSEHIRPAGPLASTGYLEDVLLLFAATRVVGCERGLGLASEEVAVQLRVPVGTRVAVITRWRTLGDAPFCVSSTYLEPGLAAAITDADLARSTFIELLEQRAESPLSGAHQVFWATTADDGIAARLGVTAGMPVLAMALTYYSMAGEPMAYTRTSFRGDRYAYHVRLGRVPIDSAQPASRMRGHGV